MIKIYAYSMTGHFNIPHTHNRNQIQPQPNALQPNNRQKLVQKQKQTPTNKKAATPEHPQPRKETKTDF